MKISVVIPIHDMENGPFFLWRAINSVLQQTHEFYEIVITKKGKMAENTNAGIRKATGDIVKILYMDDYLAHKDSLKIIANNFKFDDEWLVTGCLHQSGDEEPRDPHYADWNSDIQKGINTIGSPSVLTFRREHALFFDENLSWLLDCDLYKRYYDEYGPPKIIDDLNVVLGLGPHQTTNLLTQEEKINEHLYVNEKYD